MLRLHMLPAGHGDCIWIEYGDPSRPRRILIDGGVRATYEQHIKPRMLALPEDDRHFELLVLTHVDADHISGAIELLADPQMPATFGDVWFNGWRHIPSEFLSAAQAIDFSAHIHERGLPWNAAFDGAAIMIDETDDPLPEAELDGDLKLTVVSPTRRSLGRMGKAWKAALIKAGFVEGEEPEFLDAEEEGDPSDSLDLETLAAGRFRKDRSRPNGSSIGLLLEYRDRRLLLPGDAHAPVLAETLGWLLDERGEDILTLDSFKLPHHGSGKNVNNELLALMACPQYLVSTNGHQFGHPDHTALARIIVNGGEEPELVSNFLSDDNEVWARSELQERYGYTALYPPQGGEGISVDYE